MALAGSSPSHSSFFFNHTATPEIYTLSLHDALPISARQAGRADRLERGDAEASYLVRLLLDRKSTRLNSSHANISYAVFCLKKKTSHATLSSETTGRDRRAIGCLANCAHRARSERIE